MFRRTRLLAIVCLGLGRLGAFAAVPAAPAGVVPIAVGAMAPAFTAREVDGRVFRFDPASLKQPTLLILYRGGWCPFCNAQLKALRSVEPQIVALDYQCLS